MLRFSSVNKTMTENNEQVYEVESLEAKVKGLTGYIIKCRLAKDKRSANRIMLIISIFCIVLSIYFFTKTNWSDIIQVI